jgi:hypothetical protein
MKQTEIRAIRLFITTSERTSDLTPQAGMRDASTSVTDESLL